ncbi:MAG TPA: hypothetical protein VFQ68_42950 [Streptosporangiaceae bacterium]|nr:hypothetical protein [Streptosporangiaceae bacterium]
MNTKQKMMALAALPLAGLLASGGWRPRRRPGRRRARRSCSRRPRAAARTHARGRHDEHYPAVPGRDDATSPGS